MDSVVTQTARYHFKASGTTRKRGKRQQATSQAGPASQDEAKSLPRTRKQWPSPQVHSEGANGFIHGAKRASSGTKGAGRHPPPTARTPKGGGGRSDPDGLNGFVHRATQDLSGSGAVRPPLPPSQLTRPQRESRPLRSRTAGPGHGANCQHFRHGPGRGTGRGARGAPEAGKGFAAPPGRRPGAGRTAARPSERDGPSAQWSPAGWQRQQRWQGWGLGGVNARGMGKNRGPVGFMRGIRDSEGSRSGRGGGSGKAGGAMALGMAVQGGPRGGVLWRGRRRGNASQPVSVS